jgi:flagellar basal-body rod protein FlgG
MGLSHQALYIATAGAYANQRKLEAITNNLANASTYGYKKMW